MILATGLAFLIIGSLLYAIHIGGKINNEEKLKDELKNIHKFSDAVNRVKPTDSLHDDANNRDNL